MDRGIKSSGAFPKFLSEDSLSVAPKLLGCYLVREYDDHEIRVMIVETESYDQHDAASHSYNGQTLRTDVMFGESGHLYVYFTYGMHYCCNVVTGKAGQGEGVLIRAAMPVDGEHHMQVLRGKSGVNLSNGPAKLCQAFGIDKTFNGHNLRYAPIRLEAGKPVAPEDIISSPRIGISKEKDALRRFYIRGNPYVSGSSAKFETDNKS